MITTARVVFPGRTYATANVTSVAVRESVLIPPKGGAITLIVMGAFMSLIGISGELPMLILIGLGMLGGGIYWFMKLKTMHQYRVFVGSAGGEAEALMSYDPGFIQQVADALNHAIVRRG